MCWLFIVHVNGYEFYWKNCSNSSIFVFNFSCCDNFRLSHLKTAKMKVKSLTCRPCVCKLFVWCVKKKADHSVRDKGKHYIPSQRFHTNRTDWTVCRSWFYPGLIRTPWWPSPGTWPLGVGVLVPGTPGQACWDGHILHDPEISKVKTSPQMKGSYFTGDSLNGQKTS